MLQARRRPTIKILTHTHTHTHTNIIHHPMQYFVTHTKLTYHFELGRIVEPSIGHIWSDQAILHQTVKQDFKCQKIAQWDVLGYVIFQKNNKICC